MTQQYHDSNPIAIVIFVVINCLILSVAIYLMYKHAEKEGKDIQCIACKNRGGKYSPVSCRNYTCKYRRY